MSNIHEIITTCGTLLREDISEEECEVLSSMFQLKKLSADEILLHEGEKDNALYIVIDGDIMVTRNSGGDDYVALHHLRSGDVAGAMGFIDGNSHSATLRATEDSHVLSLSRDIMESMIDDHPQLSFKIMKMIVRSVHHTVINMNQQFVEMNNYIMKEHGWCKI